MVKKCDHTSVGMMVWRDEKLLMIERKKIPFGITPPAGHVDDHGSFKKAAEDELEEEVGLRAKNLKLLIEGREENKCRREDGNWHYWKIYEVIAEGEVKPSDDEVKGFNWYKKEDILLLAKKTEDYLSGKISKESWESSPGLEPVCYRWFKILKII